MCTSAGSVNRAFLIPVMGTSAACIDTLVGAHRIVKPTVQVFVAGYTHAGSVVTCVPVASHSIFEDDKLELVRHQISIGFLYLSHRCDGNLFSHRCERCDFTEMFK